MSHLKEFITLASLSTIFYQSAPHPVTESAIVDDSMDVPSRAAPVTRLEMNMDRVQRKPAVEPRVYVEDQTSQNSGSGYFYFDYADQTRTREQTPPEPVQ